MSDEREPMQRVSMPLMQRCRHSIGSTGALLWHGCSLYVGRRDPLDLLGAWESERGQPHWHYVTYGFSELYEKETDDPAVSGYGFELTFRLKRGEEEQPPVWPMNLLQNLARYVFTSGNVFGPGHHMNANGPIALETDTQLTALGFCTDPELGELDTPNGRLTFLQVVGLTADEMEGMICWDGEKFLTELERHLPLCITDLDRNSQMSNTEFRTAWLQGVERDGSSTGSFYINMLEIDVSSELPLLRLGAGRGEILSTVLRARVGKGRGLFLFGKDQAVVFTPGVQTGALMQDDVFTVTMTSQAVEELCQVVSAHVGVYPLNLYRCWWNFSPRDHRRKGQHDADLEMSVTQKSPCTGAFFTVPHIRRLPGGAEKRQGRYTQHSSKNWHGSPPAFSL